jgi:LacI family transcriptional regulator/LacI family repressor for deo operon, udp, cdd, tsx, nupC, and nupG
MRDVAKRAGVALSTVSIVLSNSKKYVSDEVKQRVFFAANELGYNIYLNKKNSLKTIAVILPIINSSFFSNVLNGIEDIVSRDNNLLLFYNSDYNFEKERSCLKALKKNLTGIILDSLCPHNLAKDYFNWLKEEFIKRGIPVLILERKLDDDSFYTIYLDNYKYAYIATLHLIENGHHKIAHISGSPLMLHSFERLDGYKQALRDYNITPDQELIQTGDFTPYSGYVAMKNMIDIRNDFTALFSANDQMAIGAIKALKAKGKSVPWDCAIVGFDNLSVSTLIEPALSTISVPTFQMGRMAARIILDASENKLNRKANQLDATLIIRRSSDVNAINEWDLTGW